MKAVKRWLLPVLTCLIVAAAVLLPPYLSQIRDRELTDTVHTEPAAVKDYSALEPAALPDRVWFLARWAAGDDSMSAATQPLTGGESGEKFQARMLAALAGFNDAIPELNFSLDFCRAAEFTASSLLLRDENGEFARMFRVCWSQGEGREVEVVVDGETDLVLSYRDDTGLTTHPAPGPKGYELLAGLYFSYLGLPGQFNDYQVDTAAHYCAAGLAVYTFRMGKVDCLIEPSGYVTEGGGIIFGGY